MPISPHTNHLSTHDVYHPELVDPRKNPHPWPPKSTKLVWLQPVVQQSFGILREILPETIKIRTNIDMACGGIRADCSSIQKSIITLAHHATRRMAGCVLLEMQLEEVSHRKELPPPQPDSPTSSSVRLTIRTKRSRLIESGMIPSVNENFPSELSQWENDPDISESLEIVREHGGILLLRNVSNCHLSLEIRWPRHLRNHTQGRKEKEQKVSDQGKGRVLFVDDEEMIVRMGKRLLSRHGFDVTAMSSSSEALRLFCGNPHQFDVVVTDQTMPDLSGIEFSKELLNVRPDIPVVLFSGYSDLVDALAAKAAGIREYLIKPMGIDSLASSLEKIMGEQPSESIATSPQA